LSTVPAPRRDALRLVDLDFDLPPELVAQHPAAVRDACRLLCVRRGDACGFVSRHFADLVSLLRTGDVLVRNVTRVLPARLTAVKEGTLVQCELLLVEPAADNSGWWAWARPARRLQPGTRVRLADGTALLVTAVREDGGRCVQAPAGVDLLACAHRLGAVPLPPYIQRAAEAADVADYQTVYARVEGSVAAPTAGLHFTRELLATLAAAGVQMVDLVLHVGPATFQPIRSADPLQHAMHWESFAMETGELARLDAARARGGRVIAVGTTVVRTLESLATWEAGAGADTVEISRDATGVRGRTRLFIHPPYAFRRVDAMITNFHLPRSTLLLLVDAFAGRQTMRAAYAHAVRERFRFFSYGDAMWIE
jgi:S-adenosylmethionine:tRNA ribosyltransferase-isomerase